MIVRIWRGWTGPDDAAAYQALLESEVIPGILDRSIPGLRSIELMRRADADAAGEVEFVTIMTFDDWRAVMDFAGPDGTTAVVPPAAQRLLRRYDHHSAHYTSVLRRTAR